MNMSFLRSVMRRLPASSITPMSPVCSQPSASIASAVWLGVLEVALHDVVATHHDLAGLAAGHLVAGVVDDEHLDVRASPGPTWWR